MIVKRIEAHHKENTKGYGQEKIMEISDIDENIIPSSYIQEYIDEPDLAIYANPNHFNIISHNIRSMKKNLNNLMTLTGNASIDLLLLQEIWNPSITNIPGYRMHLLKRSDRNMKNTGGGLGLLSKYPFKIIKEELEDEIEYQILEIQVHKLKILVCN